MWRSQIACALGVSDGQELRATSTREWHSLWMLDAYKEIFVEGVWKFESGKIPLDTYGHGFQ